MGLNKDGLLVQSIPKDGTFVNMNKSDGYLGSISVNPRVPPNFIQMNAADGPENS